jgi:CubicO group peptidase (beta-lactamase class C family)
MTALAVQQLIADARVPGLSMAVIHDRQATVLTAVGVRNSLDRAAVDRRTIFAAASLSKPLFAYAVLQLVDAGKLAFDTPLSLHVPDYVTDDPRAAAVTVRRHGEAIVPILIGRGAPANFEAQSISRLV